MTNRDPTVGTPEATPSRDRVLSACRFAPPDRIPRMDGFFEEMPVSWREALGPDPEISDVAIWCPDEGAFPTRARHIRQEAGWTYEVDSWGRTIRHRPDAYFSETLQSPLSEGVDIDAVDFDPPYLDDRYLQGQATLADAERALKQAKRRRCVFGKTGGPYLRSAFVRGGTQFLMDIASDPALAKAIADKMATHLSAVGMEEIRRWDLQNTGIWIYDDMGSNLGPMFSPRSFERVFLPAYRHMISAYKRAGARYVFLHSDGDIRAILDMLIDAGIDGLHPLERRAHMDIAQLRRQYPWLILAGGMDNTHTLLNGPIEKIESEAREIIDLGRDGGVIIGTHSISPEIPVEHFLAYHEVCATYGNFQSQGDST